MATRILLERRNEEEMPFLMSLLNQVSAIVRKLVAIDGYTEADLCWGGGQCLKDHPNSFNLSMFHLLIL
eukprot:1467996-Rhodomonas_salina.1